LTTSTQRDVVEVGYVIVLDTKVPNAAGTSTFIEGEKRVPSKVNVVLPAAVQELGVIVVTNGGT
jgi:hypothetical protein